MTPLPPPPPEKNPLSPASDYFLAVEQLLDAARRLDRYQRDLIDPNGAVQQGFARILQRIADHEGRIEPRLNYGASVMMALMLEVGAIKGRPPNGLTGKRVLVVEDEPLLLRILTTELTKRGAKVYPAATVADARDLGGAVQVDAALIDLRLPAIGDGRDLALWLKKQQPKTPIVLITGGSTSGPEFDGLDVFAVLEKPAPLELVEKTLHEAIEGPESPNAGAPEAAPTKA